MAEPFVLQFDVLGDKQIQRGFSRFADDVKDLREAFGEIAKDFKEVEEKQFSSEGGYGSGGWAPLSPAYAARKGGQHIMVRSGTLRDSLEGKTPYTIEDIQPLELRLGSKVNYAIYHQKGTRKMPARPLIQLTDADKTRWHKLIHKWLVKQMKREWAGLMPDIKAGERHMGSI